MHKETTMVRAPYAVVRWTHVPTGLTAKADGMLACRNQAKGLRWAQGMARRHLVAKLHRPELTPIRRTYHLDPPWGIEPYIRQDGVMLAQTLTILALSTPFMSANFMMSRVFYANEDARTPFYIQLVLAIVNVVAATIALKPISVT